MFCAHRQEVISAILGAAMRIAFALRRTSWNSAHLAEHPICKHLPVLPFLFLFFFSGIPCFCSVRGLPLFSRGFPCPSPPPPPKKRKGRTGLLIMRMLTHEHVRADSVRSCAAMRSSLRSLAPECLAGKTLRKSSNQNLGFGDTRRIEISKRCARVPQAGLAHGEASQAFA